MIMQPVPTLLIDRRNFKEQLPNILEAMASCKTLCGIDCETQDDNRHEGLNNFMRVNSETRKKAGNKKLVFDMRRTVMTGFSLYPENHSLAWYFNLDHADIENRLTWLEVKPILEAKPEATLWVAHNAPYEITAFASCFGFLLPNMVCTMQLSVTAFGDDNYDLDKFRAASLGDLEQHVRPLMMGAIGTLPVDLEPDEDGGERRRFSRAVDEIIGKITAKESVASTNYNGYVDEMAYGHGLKDLVRAFFGYEMATFKETMGESAHMGMLTGDEVSDYGASDAFWVIPLFHRLMKEVAINSPNALLTFFEQENPMIYVYSEIWIEGMKVNLEAIENRRELERAEFARLLREAKVAVRELLPFDEEPDPELFKRQDWYAKGYQKYRKKITDWANSADSADDFTQCVQVSSPVGNSWHLQKMGHELKGKNKPELSITHYMPARVFLYDLLKSKMMFDKGQLTSDGGARGKCQDWIEKNTNRSSKLIELMTAMAGVETRIKLYLESYMQLTDPETNRMYPTVNCLLNTRRMAASTPNPMQLAKRGESTYVRGFYEPDHEDHVMVSLDWSAFELVIIGELSKDPMFHKAFGQLPHEDMHAGAAADVLKVEIDWMDEAKFKALKKFDEREEYLEHFGIPQDQVGRLFTNLKGELMSTSGAAKYWRTEIGKGCNFNYFYSGFLTTVGERMGWSLQRTGEATELYRNRFSLAEEWRLDTIRHGEMYGFVELPDGHRRFRYEATDEWMEVFKAKWPQIDELKPIVHEISRRINKRAKNQLVNAMVQGTNAFVIKRSIIRLKQLLKDKGWTDREGRFLLPIHDELVWSVHRDHVVEFIKLARQVMMSHDDIFPTLKLDATPSVGLTFEPWDEKKAPFGQVELFESPRFDFISKDKWGGRLDDDETRLVIDHLERMRKAA